MRRVRQKHLDRGELVAQRKCGAEKSCFTEELAQRRGSSEKRWLREEVAWKEIARTRCSSKQNGIMWYNGSVQMKRLRGKVAQRRQRKVGPEKKQLR